jgi:tRNA A37 threonylcarbamoyladenosine modification protein TsaB
MFLLIDASKYGFARFALFSKAVLHEKIFCAENKDVLAMLDCFLRQNKFKKDNVKGIMAVVGAGSFTSTRVAVTIANTFAYVLNIPVLAVNAEDSADPRLKIAELLSRPKGIYITAGYSSGPNIGKKYVD